MRTAQICKVREDFGAASEERDRRAGRNSGAGDAAGTGGTYDDGKTERGGGSDKITAADGDDVDDSTRHFDSSGILKLLNRLQKMEEVSIR